MLELNKIYHGDNLPYLENMPDECIDLVYIDPPFCTQALQKSKTWNEKVQGAVFYDLWGGGAHGYMSFLSNRLHHIRRILKPTGSLFLHLDYRMAHYAKVELDKIFGIKNFNNEIIWCYSTSGRAPRGKRNKWAQKHDTILWYAKNIQKFRADCTVPVTEDYLESHYRQTDGKGRQCRIRVDAGKERIYYPDEGMNGTDWWEITPVNSQAKERIGYPTQKPLALLERIVECASNEGDIVFDCFCGCGTTIEAAHKQGRNWIGIDASMLACKEMKKRMKTCQKVIVDIEKQVLTKAQYMKLEPFEFEKAVVRAIGGIANTKQVGDDGVDGILSSDWTPIQVKKSEKVGRPVLDSFYKHIAKHKANRGVIIALSFGRGIKEERVRLEREEGFDIQLLTLDDVIKGNYREEQKLL